MSHVSVHYKVYLPAGHHRQPRNASAVIEPNQPSEIDVSDQGNITPLHISEIPYTLNGGSGLAKLLFWSVTDGTDGQTYPAGPLTQPVGTSPLTITAWYYPISGPGTVGESSAILVDAFSAAKGDFIDDTFVNVTSDPSLTSQANVEGIVPTKVAQTLQAYASVTSTTEPFSKWISFGAGTPSGDKTSVPVGSTGIAIAIYERSGVKLHPRPSGEQIGGTIIGGVAVDGNGVLIINGRPHPVDPWGPLYQKLVNASLVVAGSRAKAEDIGAKVRQLATQSVQTELKSAIASIEKVGKG
jgi:hypothetical protein